MRFAGRCVRHRRRAYCVLPFRVKSASVNLTIMRKRKGGRKAALRQIAGIDPWNDAEQGYVDKSRAAITQPAEKGGE